MTAGNGQERFTARDDHELAVAAWPGASCTGMPHHGRIGPDCPAGCLRTVPSLMSLNRLMAASSAPFEQSRTVGDVTGLYQQRQLGEIRGLGPRRTAEIETAVVCAGMDITGHHHG